MFLFFIFLVVADKMQQMMGSVFFLYVLEFDLGFFFLKKGWLVEVACLLSLMQVCFSSLRNFCL